MKEARKRAEERGLKVTRILQIYEYDESKLDEIRRDVYETERAGIQRQAEGIFEVYVATDFGSNVTSQRSISAGQRYNNQLGTERGRGSKTASRVKEYIFEVEESEVSGKASRELDSKYSSPEEAKASGKVSDAKFSIEFADDIANKQRKFVADGLFRISSSRRLNIRAVLPNKPLFFIF